MRQWIALVAMLAFALANAGCAHTEYGFTLSWESHPTPNDKLTTGFQIKTKAGE